MDVFLHWRERDPNKLGEALKTLGDERLALSMISNRGQKVYPDGLPETFASIIGAAASSPDRTPITHQRSDRAARPRRCRRLWLHQDRRISTPLTVWKASRAVRASDSPIRVRWMS